MSVPRQLSPTPTAVAAAREIVYDGLRTCPGIEVVSQLQINMLTNLVAFALDAARLDVAVPKDLARSAQTMLAKFDDEDRATFNALVRIARDAARREQREADARIAETEGCISAGCDPCGTPAAVRWHSMRCPSGIAQALRAGGKGT